MFRTAQLTRASFLIFLYHAKVATSLSLEVSRGRIAQALSSPSGKMTVSPELVIPEPSDPTAILLLNDAVRTLSSRIRDSKANLAFVQGSPTAVTTFAQEQDESRGNFPGPVPVIACGDIEGVEGIDGCLVPVCGGAEIETVLSIIESTGWKAKCQAALEKGIQPIPEITISHDTAESWTEKDVAAVIEAIKMDDFDPVAVVVTINPEEQDSENDDDVEVALPTIPQDISDQIPILGSVRTTAGENRLGEESKRFKEAGFSGAFLRSDCVPGFRMNPDLELVGLFWAACVQDLKSTRSKSFSFRAKNNMDKSAATNWASYQQGVIESGALGDPNDSYSIVDEAAGEYKGFA